MSLGIGLVLLNGIDLTGNDFIYLGGFLVNWLQFSFILFIIGVIPGIIFSRGIGNLAVIIAWIFLVYLSPLGVHEITYEKAKSITSNFQLALDKWAHLMGFESRAIEKEGEFDKEKAKTKPVQDLIKRFIEKEYKKMQEVDKRLASSVRKNIDFFNGISMLLPTTFYLGVCSELSSKGYENVLIFLT